MTGANKRFLSMARALSGKDGIELHILVPKSECLPVLQNATYHYLPGGSGLLHRLVTLCGIRRLVRTISPHYLISDFLPTVANSRNCTCFQLVHDARSSTEFGRWKYYGWLVHYVQMIEWRRAQNIMTVSNSTKAELVANLKIKPSKVFVVYNGLSEDYFRPRTNPKIEFDFLYVATFEERKNHISLLRAFKLIVEERQSAKLLLLGQDLGMRQVVNEEITALGIGSNVIIMDCVESEFDLIRLYDSTRVFVSPSKYEGFGMPILEAWARGCHVCCSTIPVFKELLGSEAIFFNPDEIDEIYEAMKSSLSLPRKNCELIHEARNFAWNQIFSEFIQHILTDESSELSS